MLKRQDLREQRRRQLLVARQPILRLLVVRDDELVEHRQQMLLKLSRSDLRATLTQTPDVRERRLARLPEQLRLLKVSGRPGAQHVESWILGNVLKKVVVDDPITLTVESNICTIGSKRTDCPSALLSGSTGAIFVLVMPHLRERNGGERSGRRTDAELHQRELRCGN